MSTVSQLLTVGGDLERLDAEVLLGEALGQQRAWLYAHPDSQPEDRQAAQYRNWVARRKAGEPVAYLTGWRDFWSLRLAVTPATLIPRPETELLVEHALARLPASTPCTVLDLGTGCGAIALAIASERPLARVTATDNSLEALGIATENAARLEIANVTFSSGDWYQAVASERFHLIVSNPPYVAAADPHLQSGDAAHEPRSALTPGGDGLGASATIIAGASAHLARGGQLLIEHGYDQRQALAKMITATELDLDQTVDDLAGLPRLLIASKTQAG